VRHLAVRSCDIVSNASEFQSLDPTAPAKRAGVILVFYCYFSELRRNNVCSWHHDITLKTTYWYSSRTDGRKLSSSLYKEERSQRHIANIMWSQGVSYCDATMIKLAISQGSARFFRYQSLRLTIRNPPPSPLESTPQIDNLRV